MGRIKSALVKRTAKALMKGENKFDETFSNNSRILKNSMPSKRLRNKIAGYVTRINKDKLKKAKVEKVTEQQ